MASCDDGDRPVVRIKIGATRAIVLKKLRDVTGSLFDPTGWDIRGIARSGSTIGSVVAIWDDDPAEGEGLAEVLDADAAIDPTVEAGEKWLYLRVLPTMSDTWTFHHAPLDVEVRETTGDLRQETFEALIETVPTTMYGVDA